LRSKTTKWAAVAVVAGLALAACGDDEDDPTTGADTESGTDDAAAEAPEAGSSGGDIAISGSSTVAPISSLVADVFNEEGSPANITVDDPGTGDGFALFCEGDADIADASRPIKDEEAEACESAGIEFIELEIGFDGITVLTSSANDAVECLSTADLYALLGPESDGFSNWSDAADLATTLGSTTELPDAPLDVTAPGTESGTYDAFVELAIGPSADAQVEAGAITEDQAEALRADYSSQADDNAIISGIEGSDTSLGFVGFAFAEAAGAAIAEIGVDAGDGCVEPSIETIADGSYPLSRSLFMYVNAAAADENPAIAEYVDFYVDDANLAALVEEAGYVPLPDDRRAATRQRWADRATGVAAG
jgi:phosphate transport system substrate-binding protein